MDYLIPGLIKDVVFEIFLHFIAVDPDGPFTLMLVCNSWRDLALSSPRLWTWITVDESHPDWKDRVRVAMALSRNLPMQLVLRIPFDGIEGFLRTLTRCKVVFLETPKRNRAFPQGSLLITHKEFIERRERYEELYSLVAGALSSVVSRGIEAIVESTDDTCLSFSTWTIFERVFKARTLEGQYNDIPSHLITTLVFEDKPRRTPRRVRLLNIWPYLPTLPYLRSLEMSDNFIGGDNPSTVPKITLPSLHDLSIDCGTGWLFRIRGHTFDLSSLLDRINAPVIRDITLYGSVTHLLTTVGRANDGVRPSSLTLSFLSVDNIEFNQTLHQAPIFGQLQQLTMDLFDPKWCEITGTAPLHHHLFPKLRSLVSFVSEGCSMNFHGGEELHHVLRLSMPAFDALHVVYRSGEHKLVPRHSISPRLRSFTLKSGSPDSTTYVQWFQSAQTVIIEAADLDILLTRTLGMSAAVEVLDTGISTMESHKGPHSCLFTRECRDRFPQLTVLRSTTDVAMAYMSHFDMHSIQEITLCIDEFGNIGPFDSFVSMASTQAHLMTRLEILGMEAFPPWPLLIHLISTYKPPHRDGFTTVRLPGIPHPSMLRPLIDAFEGRLMDYTVGPIDDDQESWEDSRKLSCSACLGSGWTCYEGPQCERFSSDTMVSITKDTYVGKFI